MEYSKIKFKVMGYLRMNAKGIKEDYPKESNPDIPLLRKHIEWVEEQDKKDQKDRANYKGLKKGEKTWDQGYWFKRSNSRASSAEVCRSAMCLAGNVAHDAGATFVFPHQGAASTDYLEDEEGQIWEIPAYAAQKLGITEYQADGLFDGENTATDLRRIAEEIAGERL